MATEKDIHINYTIHSWPLTVTTELCCWAISSYLVRLVAEVTAEGLGSTVRGLVFFQQGAAGEHLVAGGTLVELFWVVVLDVLPMLLQRGETETTLLTVMRLWHVCQGMPGNTSMLSAWRFLHLTLPSYICIACIILLLLSYIILTTHFFAVLVCTGL